MSFTYSDRDNTVRLTSLYLEDPPFLRGSPQAGGSFLQDGARMAIADILPDTIKAKTLYQYSRTAFLLSKVNFLR
ncbi:hypothetical protein [Nostoc sp. CmiVER01]|uniref:hypothetical protein n=1 Tax=Nostoc sp. CmiVER01 TaxID=3075384 RepID=UPI002AD23D14|nr:hypothetical protein [Nostoc sp. CmiVER01]MDZ8124225.1 hypothetical protein [Nostoc sp. CmiVER01]